MEINIPFFLRGTSRKITSREHNGKSTRVLTIDRTYKTTRSNLWEALTTPERIQRWFLPISGNLQPGGRFQLEGNAGGDILACVPPSHFDITWEFGGDTSWVTVRLTDAHADTRLTLEHIAMVPDEMWNQYGPGAVGVGWELGLLGLDRHLESGAPVDPAAFAAWSASPEGKELIRSSSAGWAEASIAAGTPEEAARAAADRTTAFYTEVPATTGE